MTHESIESIEKTMICPTAYMAVKMYWAMSREDRILASEWHIKFRRSFSLRKFLKERKTKSRKSYLPPAPPMLKKEYKEKTDKTTPTTARVKRTLIILISFKIKLFSLFQFLLITKLFLSIIQ